MNNTLSAASKLAVKMQYNIKYNPLRVHPGVTLLLDFVICYWDNGETRCRRDEKE